MKNARRSPANYPNIIGLLLVATLVVAGVASASRNDEVTAESPREKVTCPADKEAMGDVDRHRPSGASEPHALLNVELGVGLRSAAFLRLDLFGRIVAAATNTGCPPRQTDDLYVIWGGKVQQTTDINISRLRWKGDFSAAGRYYPQDRLRWCPLSRRC
jgi:hypothetical protein